MTTTTNAERLALADDVLTTVNEAWSSLFEKDKRRSSDDYPGACLITYNELRDFMQQAAALRAQPADAGVREKEIIERCATRDQLYDPTLTKLATDAAKSIGRTLRLDAIDQKEVYRTVLEAMIVATPPRPALNDPVVEPRNSEEGNEVKPAFEYYVDADTLRVIQIPKGSCFIGDQKVVAICSTDGGGMNVAKRICDMLNATQPPPAVSGEVREAGPVAWRWKWGEGDFWKYGDNVEMEKLKSVLSSPIIAERLYTDPLYALPLIADQSAALAEARRIKSILAMAAQTARDALAGSDRTPMLEAALSVLNHALQLEAYHWQQENAARAAIDRIDAARASQEQPS